VRRSGLLLLLAFGATVLTPGGAVARSPADAKVERKLVGTWNLVSFVLLDQQDAVVSYPYGQPPAGKLTYTSDGQVWATLGPSGPEAADLPATWYTVRFRVNATRKLVIHHVAFSSVPDWIGTDLLRQYDFAGPRRLTLSTLPAGPEGSQTHGVLVWTRRR
jgi:Lipocalin-like domain